MANKIVSVKFDKSLADKLQSMKDKVMPAFLMIAETEAVKLESYMKTHRPWTDRTGMAKQTLNVRVSQPNQSSIRITLAHGVDYGIWLELAHEQNYAIVNPTLKLKSSEVISAYKNFIKKLA